MMVELGAWKTPLAIATISGSVFAGLVQAIEPHLSATSILTGVLTGVSVLLFGMFIRQGNKLAALEAYSKRNKDDIDRIDGEVRTVDKRDSDSRHLVKNEIAPVIAEVELRCGQRIDEARLLAAAVEARMGMRFDEMRERLALAEERLQRHVETQAARG